MVHLLRRRPFTTLPAFLLPIHLLLYAIDHHLPDLNIRVVFIYYYRAFLTSSFAHECLKEKETENQCDSTSVHCTLCKHAVDFVTYPCLLFTTKFIFNIQKLIACAALDFCRKDENCENILPSKRWALMRPISCDYTYFCSNFFDQQKCELVVHRKK